MSSLRRSLTTCLALALLWTAVTDLAAAPVNRIVVLHTNDTHGQLFPMARDDLGGIARRATLIERERARATREDAAVLLVDAGDINTGTYESDQTRGLLDLRVMKALGYDAAAVGNHEFDLREPDRRAFAEAAPFPLLSANVRRPDGQREYRPWTVVTRGERRLALVGLVTPATPRVSTFGRLAPVRFTDPAEELESSLDEIEALEPGVDAVLVLSHLGDTADRALIPRFQERVSAWVGGHTHFPGRARFPRRTLFVRAEAKGRTLGRFELLFHAGRVEPVNAEEIPVDASIPASAEVAAMLPRPAEGAAVALATAPFSKYHPEGRRRSGPLGNLLADALRELGDCDVTLVNRGGIRVHRLPEGPLQARQLYAVSPFKNSLHRFSLDREQLRAVFRQAAALGVTSNAFPDVSGVRVEIDGDEVRLEFPGGDPPEGPILLGVTDFLAQGGDGYEVFADFPSPEVVPATPAEMLIEYARRRKTLTPDETPRIRVIPGRP